MKGLAFYLEYPEGVNPNKFTRKNLGTHQGNVMAVFTDKSLLRTEKVGSQIEFITEGIGALQYHANSAVCSTAVSYSYLRERTKRISEEMARQIHPNLFARLDD